MNTNPAITTPLFSPVLNPATIEQQLRGYTILFNTIAEAVLILGADAAILHANAAAKRLTGYSRAELTGQRPALWQRPQEASERADEVEASLRETGAWQGEYTLVRRDGTCRAVESNVRAVTDADGRLQQMITVLRDITGQRQLEVELLQVQKIKAIGSLGAGIAHEINTPIQYVADNMQFLDDGLQSLRSIVREGQALAAAARTDPALSEWVTKFDDVVRDVDLTYLDMQLPDAAHHAREGCARVREIVKALTRFATPTSAGKMFTDINASIRDALTVSRNDWKTVASVSTDLDASLPRVDCISAEINQVFLNIIVNAAQAITAGRDPSQPMGKISISSRHEASWVEIRVTDDGPGIPVANQSRVFDPFFSTRDSGKALGHGLASAHVCVVTHHGGRLTVESVEGQGAAFIIQLPISAAAETPLSA